MITILSVLDKPGFRVISSTRSRLLQGCRRCNVWLSGQVRGQNGHQCFVRSIGACSSIVAKPRAPSVYRTRICGQKYTIVSSPGLFGAQGLYLLPAKPGFRRPCRRYQDGLLDLIIPYETPNKGRLRALESLLARPGVYVGPPVIRDPPPAFALAGCARPAAESNCRPTLRYRMHPAISRFPRETPFFLVWRALFYLETPT